MICKKPISVEPSLFSIYLSITGLFSSPSVSLIVHKTYCLLHHGT